MTPCQKLGYKVGDQFVALKGSLFPEGTIVTLSKDDGTSIPLFAGEGSPYYCAYDDEDRSIAGAYEDLDLIQPL